MMKHRIILNILKMQNKTATAKTISLVIWFSDREKLKWRVYKYNWWNSLDDLMIQKGGALCFSNLSSTSSKMVIPRDLRKLRLFAKNNIMVNSRCYDALNLIKFMSFWYIISIGICIKDREMAWFDWRILIYKPSNVKKW